MKVLKKGAVVGVFVVVLILLYAFGGNITGNIIEDVIDVGNCSDSLINVLWDSVFEEGNSGIVVLKENVVGGDMCEEYIAYKNNSDGEFWVIGETLYDNSWDGVALRYSSGKKILNETLFFATYMDLNGSFLETLGSLSDIDAIISAVDAVGVDELVNWSVQSEGSAKSKIDSLFFVDVSGFSFGETSDAFEYSDSVTSDWMDSAYDISILKNDSLITIGDYSIVNYDPLFVVNFMADISDYGFDRNSSWNVAFNLSDHFNVSDDVVVSFSSVGTNNTNGAWINYSISGGVVSFKPALNFTGYREFRMMASNPAGADVLSNVFNISVAVPNDLPILKKNFDPIAVPDNGETRIVLSVYFEDPDGDDMTYRSTGDEDLNITFSGGLMTIRLEDAFKDTSKFRVYASDGIGEKGSNNIYVYREGDVAAAALIANLTNNDSELTLLGETVVGGDDNNSGASAGDGGDGGANWVLWVVVGVIVLVLVLLAIWFFALKGEGAPASDVSGGVVAPGGVAPGVVGAPIQTPVNSYLNKLNLPRR